MNRIAVLLQNKAPQLQGSVRVNVSGDRELWPNFRVMLGELRAHYTRTELLRALGLAESALDHVSQVNAYWNVSYKQGIRMIQMYEETVKKPVPYL